MGTIAVWEHKGRKYFLMEKEEKGPEEGEYLTTNEFIKKIASFDEKIMESLEKGSVVYDPYGIVNSLKEGIRKNLFLSTYKTIIARLAVIILEVEGIEKLKEDILINLYQAATDALQAIIIKKKGVIKVPKEIPNFVKKNLPEFYEDAVFYEKILQTIKKYEIERKMPPGEVLDELIYMASEIFEDALRV